MTHTYSITGMTCNKCVAKVKSELLKLGNVQSADVQLASPQATITMNGHISTQVLQQAIQQAGKYTIQEADSGMDHAPDTASNTTSYFPIFLIFGYIAGASLLAEIGTDHFELMKWMRYFMAGFFLVFSFFKLLNLRGFADGYSSYDVVARRVNAWGFIYPFVELTLGVAFLTGFEPLTTNIVTFLVMGVSTIGVVQSLRRKSAFQCACLGTIIKLPLSRVTLFEDVLMMAMSAFMIIKIIS